MSAFSQMSRTSLVEPTRSETCHFRTFASESAYITASRAPPRDPAIAIESEDEPRAKHTFLRLCRAGRYAIGRHGLCPMAVGKEKRTFPAECTRKQKPAQRVQARIKVTVHMRWPSAPRSRRYARL